MERSGGIGCWMVVLMFFVLTGCDAVGTSPQAETFAAADRPSFVSTTDAVGTYQVLKPWNYDKSWNSTRQYPLVAAIVRAAGASQTTLDSRLADKTSVWYHIGLNDDPGRVKVAADAFTFLQTWPGNRMVSLGMKDDRVGGYARRTLSVVKAGNPIALKSEYTGLGHDDGPVYQDPTVLGWLFRQSLGAR